MGIAAAPYTAASGQPPAGDAANAVLAGVLAAVGPTQPFAFRGPMNLAIWADINTALTTTAGSLAASVASATGLAAGDAVNSVNAPDGATLGTLAGTNATLALPPVTLWASASTFGPQLTGLASTAGLLGAEVSGPGIAAGVVVDSIVQQAVPATANAPGIPGIVALSQTPTSVVQPLGSPQPFTFTPNGNAITATGADANATFTGAAVTWDGTIQLERSFDGGKTWLVGNIGSTGTLAQWTGATVGPIQLTFGEPEKNVLYRLNCIAFTSGVINYRISQTGGGAESLAIGQLI